MPSLQFDAPRAYDAETKRVIARELGRAYARIMQTAPDLVTVAIHDLGQGGIWRCTEREPQEAALVMCDIRAGRTPATRAELAEEIIAICATRGDLQSHQIKVEFTQHPGDDMYHPHLGGFNHDWSGDETSS